MKVSKIIFTIIGVGFVRSRKMLNYYLNGNDAYKLKLWLNNFNVD